MPAKETVCRSRLNAGGIASIRCSLRRVPSQNDGRTIRPERARMERGIACLQAFSIRDLKSRMTTATPHDRTLDFTLETHSNYIIPMPPIPMPPIPMPPMPPMPMPPMPPPMPPMPPPKGSVEPGGMISAGLGWFAGQLGEFASSVLGLHGPGTVGPPPGKFSEVVLGGGHLADFLVVGTVLVGFLGFGLVDHVERVIEPFILLESRGNVRPSFF